MQVLSNFFAPYHQFLRGAAYNIQQSLEGLAWRSSFSTDAETGNTALSSAWDIDVAVNEIYLFVVVYAALLCPLVFAAGYIIGRKKGLWIIAALLVFPGLLSVTGLFPVLNYEPDLYVIGSGILGSWRGIVPLLMLGVITGWSLIIILCDTFNLADKFRQYYDHLWYLAALLTAVFFVMETQVNYQSRVLEQNNQLSRQTSLYFLDQIKRYDEYCHISGVENLLSCKWASRIQQRLNDYASQDSRGYYNFGPKSSRDFYDLYQYGISDQVIAQIRREIHIYNEKQCPIVQLNAYIYRHAPASGRCQMPPASYCTGLPEPPVWHVQNSNLQNNNALASECLIPTLVMQRRQQEKLVFEIAEQQKAKYYRWMFYIFFSLIVGGKIANSTTKAIELDKRDKNQQQRIIPVLKEIYRFFAMLMVKGSHFLCKIIVYLFVKVKAVFAYSMFQWHKRKRDRGKKN